MYIKRFDELGMQDVLAVGGKNASLGQMRRDLSNKGVIIPDGFAITADAYWYYLESNGFIDEIKKLIGSLESDSSLSKLQQVGFSVRALIGSGAIPADLVAEIVAAYNVLCDEYEQEIDVAVRSSATAEDSPTLSFAGQQESYLNIKGHKALLAAYINCITSLFTDRAIAYRKEQGVDHFSIGLSVGVQKMVRSDLACSGVAFSLDPQTGFKELVVIDGSVGLGESIVKGLVSPDEWAVHKGRLLAGYTPIVKKELGNKETKIMYADGADKPTVQLLTSQHERDTFCLTDQQVCALARMVIRIEEYYSALNNTWMPMDIEWALDGTDGMLYIVQARPETVHSKAKKATVFTTYQRDTDQTPTVIASGASIGQHIVSGNVRIIDDVAHIDKVQSGDIIVTVMTDPDWVPALKKAAGIVTQRGGRTCHAAIVSRELGIPALVGVEDAVSLLKPYEGAIVTVDCTNGATGYVYAGAVAFKTHEIPIASLGTSPVPLMVTMADPERALSVASLPIDGVGLARLEFIMSSVIKLHPLAVIHPEKITDPAIARQIEERTRGYADGKDFFVDALASGIGMIAAAFYPRPVIARLSDFKTNEYRNLIGGSYFEPVEENPMLGIRGASRYYNTQFSPAFALECAAFKKVRSQMGFDNIKIMVPFVRTVDEAYKVIECLNAQGLKRGEDGLEIIMMCEIPSNVLLIEEFAQLFDGFSIGSNDLTQLTLGVDRDSGLLARLFDERNPAVLKMLELAIAGARSAHVPIGVCGQAPSDYPEIADFLIKRGISSLSLNADSILPFLMR